MNILLTGGSGFLGSQLVFFFVGQGYKIDLLLRAESRLDRIRGLKDNLKIYRFSNFSEIDGLIRKANPNLIIHTACNYGRKGESDSEIMNANFNFGASIITSLIKNKKQITFINANSCLPKNVCFYAETKNLFSNFCVEKTKDNPEKFQFIDIVLQHFYGPGDDREKFTSKIFYDCFNNVSEILLTKGSQQRDFIFIEDVVRAFGFIVKNSNKLKKVHTFQVGSGISVSVREFVELVHKLTKSQTKLLFGKIPTRMNEPKNCLADLSEINKLGWWPEYTLEEGVIKTINLEYKYRK